jgi:hypothetical protein
MPTANRRSRATRERSRPVPVRGLEQRRRDATCRAQNPDRAARALTRRVRRALAAMTTRHLSREDPEPGTATRKRLTTAVDERRGLVSRVSASPQAGSSRLTAVSQAGRADRRGEIPSCQYDRRRHIMSKASAGGAGTVQRTDTLRAIRSVKARGGPVRYDRLAKCQRGLPGICLEARCVYGEDVPL